MSLGSCILANRKSIELELELAVRLDWFIVFVAFRVLTSLERRSKTIIMSGPQFIIATIEEGLSELLITFPIEHHVNTAVNLLLSLLFEFLSLLKA
jgi:hypothetical protein